MRVQGLLSAGAGDAGESPVPRDGARTGEKAQKQATLTRGGRDVPVGARPRGLYFEMSECLLLSERKPGGDGARAHSLGLQPCGFGFASSRPCLWDWDGHGYAHKGPAEVPGFTVGAPRSLSCRHWGALKEFSLRNEHVIGCLLFTQGGSFWCGPRRSGGSQSWLQVGIMG